MKCVIILAVAVLSLGVYGCSTSEDSTTPAPSSSPSAQDGSSAHADHEHGNHVDEGDNGVTGMEKMKAELANLSPADATSAEKQHICPVSGEMLGTMGAPIKIDLKGQEVWICCDGCREKLLANPDDYLAKLKN
ncbi:hypothetical protein [Botrimarina mediterranea]|uniref:YHS domain protein n=1 Tax=Botrimarina mediterranea TaxID=2528022 RepID=A0A518K7L3_9BACT|nr:hypothetical protein [Botrimarina mediterranea]QDV73783.1 hypothetical protein Spa11_19820 [Botrimarina mediterranea]QDV78429.1 hypothetical protein K2D_20360 [Planctomycetes bacterium K2D]